MRLIDAEAAVKEIDDALRKVFKEQVGEGIISRVPTVDAVPVVRCKDCKHFAGEGMYCAWNIIVQFDHFYCYHGEMGAALERKELP